MSMGSVQESAPGKALAGVPGKSAFAVMVITGPAHCGAHDMVALARQVFQAGVRIVQYRDKGGDTAEKRERIARLLALAAQYGGIVMINDDPALAAETGAHGVHIGREDAALAHARALLPRPKIVGITAKSPADILAIDDVAGGWDLVDYVSIGGVYATRSKVNPEPPIGRAGLRALAELVRARFSGPIVAIAGMCANNIPASMTAPIDGVCVISAIADAENPGAQAVMLRRLVRAARPVALSIAGSDSGGGAGIQADIKAISACGAYAATVLTAVTAQNTLGVDAVHDIPPSVVAAQMDAVMADIAVGAGKIGMLGHPALAELVAQKMDQYRDVPMVLDPVMVAKGGFVLLAPEAVAPLREAVMPRAHIVTPNLAEAGMLLGRAAPGTHREMQQAAEDLQRLGAQAVLLKGGHLAGAGADNYFAAAGAGEWLRYPRIATRNTHGTGCTLSAAMAAYLAQGMALPEAVAAACDYVHGAIRAADTLGIGGGCGPVHHFYRRDTKQAEELV